MTKDEALGRLDDHDTMTREQESAAVVTALEHGNSRDDVAARLGLTYDELMDRHGLDVRNAGKLGSFKGTGESPRVVDLDAD